MLLGAALLVGGGLILYLGAEIAVRGAVWLSRAAGLPMFALGALLFGLDPEGLGVAVVAAGRGHTELAAGSIFGSVVFVFSAAFGVALVVARRPVPAPSPIMLAAPAAGVMAAALAIADRYISRFEALLLLLLYAAYVGLVFADRRWPAERDPDSAGAGTLAHAPPRERVTVGLDHAPEEGGADDPGLPDVPGRIRALPAAVAAGLGLGLLVLGASMLVGGGIRVAAGTGLTAGFVGAALVGVLTSLDEVLLEVLPIRRGTPELATGNLFGTLAAFTTGVPGIAGLIRPLLLDGGDQLAFLALAFLYALVATVFFVRGKVGWLLGLSVLSFYAIWLVVAATF